LFLIDAFSLKEGTTETHKRIFSQMVKYGLENCLVSNEKLNAEETLNDIPLGKRALIGSLPTYKSILSVRVKHKGLCGFYLGKSVVNEQHYMLYNKKLNKDLKEKIDLKYVNLSI